MPNALTPKYPSFLASMFRSALATGTSVAYVFLGRPHEWSAVDDVTITDSNPPIPQTHSQAVDFDYWRDMIGAKRVGIANTQFVVSRRDWETGTVYDYYDDQNENLYESDFYVFDDTEVPYKVYKCLWNNNGQPSTSPPSGLGVSPLPGTTADGYVWQYLYSIGSDNYKFLTENWMPVLSDAAVIASATTFAGRLVTDVPLLILDGGTGYNAAIETTTVIVGDGAGANVTSNGVTIVSGSVNTAIFSSGGERYTQITSISISQNGVSNTAVARAIIPPYPNHGADPVKELGTKALMLTVTFDDSEGGNLSVGNDFRRVGLLINPTTTTGNVATNSYHRQTYDLTFSSNTGILLPDETIVNLSKSGGPSAVVVDVIDGPDTNYIVRLTNVNPAGQFPPFEADDIIKNLDSGVEVTIDTVAIPELQPYSGSVVYINQRTPVTRDTGQAEELKIVFPFG